jgi:hypothetical protein
MLYDENDINFLKLSDADFEEVCFDLLLRLGYKGLVWRRGGADNGRDIEGQFAVSNSLIGTYDEKWFFECKRYEAGVPPEQMNSKFAWADADKPKHLVFLISSYLTNNARTWLDKIASDKAYKVHLVEGKQLKLFLLNFPDIVSRYFVDEYEKLLLASRRSWLVHDVLPDLETISLLFANLDPNKLDISELAFIWCATKIRATEIDGEWVSNHTQFHFDVLFQHVAANSNCAESILLTATDYSTIQIASGIYDWEMVYPKYIVARILLDVSTRPRLAMYSFVSDSEGEGVEVLVEATSDFPAKIRHVASNARSESIKTSDLLFTKLKGAEDWRLGGSQAAEPAAVRKDT